MAGGGPALQVKTLATLTHPAHSARRHPDHQSIGRDIGGDHGAGTDERVLPDGTPTDDRGIGTDAGATPDQRQRVFVLARYVTARGQDIGEHAGRTAEHVIFQRYALVDGDVVLDLDVVAYV